MNDHDRAVSVTVGYAMNLALMTILLSGLFIASGGLIESERERAASDELDVIGQQVASELMAADRLVSTSNNSTVELTMSVSAPARVAGSGYTMAVEGDRLVLVATDIDVEMTVRFTTATTVKETQVTGGDLRIVWNDNEQNDGGQLVVTE